MTDELDQLRVQLAGCLTAAEGHISEDVIATKEMYGWSPAYEAVLQLRRAYEALLASATKVRDAFYALPDSTDTPLHNAIAEMDVTMQKSGIFHE